MLMRRTLLALPALLLAPRARAQAYPAHAIRIIVPFPAGGGYDVTARFLAEALSRDIAQPVVVENRTSGSGVLGMETGFRAAPDGYTLTLTGAAVTTAGPHLRKPPYDPLGFRHITRLVRMPFVLAVKKDLPVQDLAGFIALAKQRPLTYAASGIGTSQHLTGELFNQTAGTSLTLVPYRGTNPALNDLAAGVVDAAFTDPAALGMIQAGQIRAIAVTSPDRWALLPTVQAAAEVLPGCVAENWYGLAAPPATPEEIVRFLHAKVSAVLADPALAKRYDDAGLHLALMPTTAFEAFLRTDSGTWRRVVERGNIRLEQN